MQTRNRLLDDLARVAAGALGVASGMRREAEEVLKARLAAVFGADGLVTREEFDAVKTMAAKARAENAKLAARLDALEAAQKAARRAKAPVRKRRVVPAGSPARGRKTRTVKPSRS